MISTIRIDRLFGYQVTATEFAAILIAFSFGMTILIKERRGFASPFYAHRRIWMTDITRFVIARDAMGVHTLSVF